MWWEQLVLLLHCTVGMFFSMVENGIFEDEMNTFGSISVVGCFTWLLFAIELTGDAIWLLPMMSMVCLVPADMLMIRYGALDDGIRWRSRPTPKLCCAVVCSTYMQVMYRKRRRTRRPGKWFLGRM